MKNGHGLMGEPYAVKQSIIEGRSSSITMSVAISVFCKCRNIYDVFVRLDLWLMTSK